MKKLLVLALIFCSLTVFAQEKIQSQADRSNDEMASLKAKRLSMQLDLNEQQQEKLKIFFAERMETNKELRQEMREERMEMNDKQKAQLREILTQEQYQKWEGLMEKRRKGRNLKMKNKDY